MLSKDKFQIQSAIVPPDTDVYGLPPDLVRSQECSEKNGFFIHWLDNDLK